MARKLAVLVRNLVANLEGASFQGSQVLPHIQESLTKFRNHKSVTRGHKLGVIRKLGSHIIRKPRGYSTIVKMVSDNSLYRTGARLPRTRAREEESSHRSEDSLEAWLFSS